MSALDDFRKWRREYDERQFIGIPLVIQTSLPKGTAVFYKDGLPVSAIYNIAEPEIPFTLGCL